MVARAPHASLPLLQDLFGADQLGLVVREISSTLTEGVLLAGPTGELIWHNPVALGLLNMASDDLLGRQLDDERWHAITLDGAPYPLSEIRARLRESPAADLSTSPVGVRTGDSRLKWFTVAITPIEVDGLRHTVVVLSDITDQIAQRRSLKQAMDSLRLGLAPAKLPTSDVVSFAAGRRHGGDDPLVGADFYDIDVDATGEIARFALGDSVGPDAAAVGLSITALTSIRSISGIVSGPAAAIDRLDDIIDDRDPRLCVTAVCGAIERHYGIATLSLVCAGHALPILIRDGRATEIGSMSPMIGVASDSGRTATRHELRTGDIVVAYTDGLTGCVVPQLSTEDLMDRIPVNAPVGAVVDVLLRMFDAVATGEHGVAVLGLEIR